MAVLTATIVGDRLPQGRYIQQTVRVTPGAGAADEWIAAADLGMSEVVAVLGVVPIGATPSLVLPSFTKNARGTGVAEGTNLGDLGIEDTAGSVVMEVTVLGKLG